MKKLIYSISIIALTISSCTLAKISGRGAVPITLNQLDRPVDVIEHVSVKKAIYFDWTSSFDISDLMADLIAEKKPDAIINVSLRVKRSFGNFLVNTITGGLAAGKTMIVEADFVKYKLVNP